MLAYILQPNLQPNRSEAQDILRETNVVLWQEIGVFRERTNFKAHLLPRDAQPLFPTCEFGAETSSDGAQGAASVPPPA